MPLSIMVIDDFYQDPMAVRRAALQLDYPVLDAPQNYAGRNSRQALLVGGIEGIVSRLVSEDLVATPNTAHCYCRIALEGDNDRQLFGIHIDNDVWWAGLLYLTLPEHCRGGTEFYRHKETKSDRAPVLKQELAALGARNFAEAGIPIIARDHKDRSCWEHLMTVPMRFNRLILLRPWLWHAAGESFGTSLENGRLVQVFFFNPAAAF